MYSFYFKPLLDYMISIIGFIILSPLFLIFTLLLSFTNGGSPFFIQSRPGKNGKVFRVVKFKTMNDTKDSEGNLLPDANRLTPIGKFVRKTSMDEIPQLLNVINGDMSLVGPRPLLVEYLPLYNKEQTRRHEVKPGMTGWAQVNGRNAINWKQKFEYDVWYVDHMSFWLDLKIIILTIKKVIIRDGINASEVITMDPFNGN